MYGAKAAQIRRIARMTWEVQSNAEIDKKIDQAIFDIAADNNIEIEALTELPEKLKTEEFVRLVIALADCPLVQ